MQGCWDASLSQTGSHEFQGSTSNFQEQAPDLTFSFPRLWFLAGWWCLQAPVGSVLLMQTQGVWNWSFKSVPVVLGHCLPVWTSPGHWHWLERAQSCLTSLSSFSRGCGTQLSESELPAEAAAPEASCTLLFKWTSALLELCSKAPLVLLDAAWSCRCEGSSQSLGLKPDVCWWVCHSSEADWEPCQAGFFS